MTTHDDRVVVVVVTYNSRRLLADFVGSLEAGMAGVSYQLVAVDNASQDGSADLMRELAPDAVVVETGRNAGYAAGINAGVAAAGPHRAVLVVNSDVRLHEGCVAELLTGLRKPGVGIAVPRLVDECGVVISSMRREPKVTRAFADALLGARRAGRQHLGEVVTDWSQYEREQRTDWAEGSTQLISDECWAACGPWDESFFLYSEETEFDLRARERGFATLFMPSAHATHLCGGSGVSNGLWRLQILNRVRFFRRRHGLAPTALFWLALLIRESSRAALGRPDSWAAVRGLLSPPRWRTAPGPEALR